MKDKAYRVNAFTIMEVTISMLIAAIVIGITYTSYTILSKSYLIFKQKNEDMAMIASLDRLLGRDFEQADLITGNGSKVFFESSSRPLVNYEFTNDYIIRKALSIDTFKIKNNNCQLLFEDKLKNNSEGINSESDRIDELLFITSFQSESIPYHYIKQYSSENLIKRNPNAIN